MREIKEARARADRLLEREREINRRAGKVITAAEARAVLRGIFGIAGRLGGILGGVLFPGELGVGELGPGDIPVALPIPRPVLERLPGQKPRRPALEQISVKAKRIVLKPGQAPLAQLPGKKKAPESAPKAITRPTPTPYTPPAAVSRRAAWRMPWAQILGLVGAASLGRSTASTSSLTRLQQSPVPSPSPQPTPYSPGAPIYPQARIGTDQCQCPTKKRKPARKCKTRGNVAWTSGAKKGRLAGTKCLQFEG